MEDEQPLLRFNYSTNHNLATRHIYEKDSDIYFQRRVYVTSIQVNRKLSLTLCLPRDVKVYDTFTFRAKHQGNTHNSYNLSDTTKKNSRTDVLSNASLL
jgi:hypothetical protein